MPFAQAPAVTGFPGVGDDHCPRVLHDAGLDLGESGTQADIEVLIGEQYAQDSRENRVILE